MEIIQKIKIEENGNISSEILDKVENKKLNIKQKLTVFFIFLICNLGIVYLVSLTDFTINHVSNDGILIFCFICLELIICSTIIEAVKINSRKLI